MNTQFNLFIKKLNIGKFTWILSSHQDLFVADPVATVSFCWTLHPDKK